MIADNHRRIINTDVLHKISTWTFGSMVTVRYRWAVGDIFNDPDNGTTYYTVHSDIYRSSPVDYGSTGRAWLLRDIYLPRITGRLVVDYQGGNAPQGDPGVGALYDRNDSLIFDMESVGSGPGEEHWYTTQASPTGYIGFPGMSGNTLYDVAYGNTMGRFNQWTGSTPTPGSGPTGAVEGTYYIYYEQSGNGVGYPSMRCSLVSPEFTPS